MVSLTIVVRPGLRGWAGTGREGMEMIGTLLVTQSTLEERERNGSFQTTERKASETKLLRGMRSPTRQPA